MDAATPTASPDRTIPGRLRRRCGRLGDAGASLVEYALLLALIAIACFGALTYFGGQSHNSVGHSSNCIDYYVNGQQGASPTC